MGSGGKPGDGAGKNQGSNGGSSGQGDEGQETDEQNPAEQGDGADSYSDRDRRVQATVALHVGLYRQWALRICRHCRCKHHPGIINGGEYE